MSVVNFLVVHTIIATIVFTLTYNSISIGFGICIKILNIIIVLKQYIKVTSSHMLSVNRHSKAFHSDPKLHNTLSSSWEAVFMINLSCIWAYRDIAISFESWKMWKLRRNCWSFWNNLRICYVTLGFVKYNFCAAKRNKASIDIWSKTC